MIETIGMTINEILIVSGLILVLLDIFIASDVPTLVAYLLFTFSFSRQIDMPILYQILFGILILVALVIFHYLIWRKVIESINDRFITPTKHIGGLDGFVGQEGVIKEVEGSNYIYINGELHQYRTDKEVHVGSRHVILKTESNKLIF